MVIKTKKNTLTKTKLLLVFFSVFLFLSCFNNTNYKLNVKDDKIVNIWFFKTSNSNISIVLKDKKQPIFGDFTKKNDTLVFTPVIPLSSNTSYQIKRNGIVISEFFVETSILKNNPKILDIYPKIDTVPENLLKMYIIFSKPMQQVKDAKEFISVYDLTKNKEIDIFLDLETELWNNNNTELTLWLDPGRIKKGLIPNEKQGKPIEQGKKYLIKIDRNWFDTNENSLDKDYQKEIFVTQKDIIKPSKKQLQIFTPEFNTKNNLKIESSEELDMMLIEDNFSIYMNNTLISGAFSFDKKAKIVYFKPNNKWTKGNYKLIIKSQQEDLAGNNFNRLFDRDIKKDNINPLQKIELEFSIQ